MGTHTNYRTVESDEITVMYLILIAIIGIILYYTFKVIKTLIKRHYYKQFKAEQRNIEQYKKIKAQKERIYQNTVDNFINNRIEEDVENDNTPLPSSAKALINIYKEK